MDVSLRPGFNGAPVLPYAAHGCFSCRSAGLFPFPSASDFLLCGCLVDPSLPRCLEGLRLAQEVWEMHVQMGVFMSHLRRGCIYCFNFLVKLGVLQGHLLLQCCTVDLGVSVVPSSACVLPQPLLKSVAPLDAVS